jgi:tetratricopeptide (TPR) repeat protein
VLSCKKKNAVIAKQKKNIEYFSFLDSAEKHFNNQEFDSAFYYYNKSKLACNETKDNDKIIYSILKMAIIQQAQADYSGSETNATEAISYFESNTNPFYKCGVFNVLAVNYKHLFDFDNAIYYYKEAIKNNIAVLNMNKLDYQQAIQILLPLTLKKKALNNDENSARLLDNLGYSY